VEKPLHDDRSKLIKIENAKNRMLKQLEEGDFRNLTARVAFILNHYPETRDSDLKLTLKYWETFQNGLFNNGTISRENYLKLEQQSDITRARAKIQNDFGSFIASEEVRQRRTEREQTFKHAHVELSEDATPVTYIFCDESGKTQDYVIVGSLWAHGDSMASLRAAINDFKKRIEWTLKDEFHFVKVDKKNIDIYKELVDIVADHSSTIGFKACCFKKVGSAQKIDDIVTKLYLVGIYDGLNHEVETGRVALPRTLNVLKDAEDGKDKLIIATQRLELQTHIKTKFDGKANVGYFDSAPSVTNLFIQVVDVFTSCLGRKLNIINGTNAKDELANYFFEKFNIDTESLTSVNYDFIKIGFIE
jgi:hypothetical protein